jgi:4-hydroxysphinganine ceramide fatty acyl 2-hydroxylase
MMKAKYAKEFLLFPDIIVMIVLLFVSASYTAIHVTYAFNWLMIILGMIGFSTMEYFTHRFFFHLKTPRNPFLLKMLKRLHYDHHADPDNLHLLFLPLWYSLPFMVISASIVYVITFDFILTVGFTTGVIIFFLFYEWKHYIAHRPIQPWTPWGKWMKKVHKWHHYKNENYWYGVTHPGLDYVLGTFRNQEQVEKSPTARNLEKRGTDMDV